MKWMIPAAICAALGSIAPARATTVKQQSDGRWALENARLTVTVNPANGAIEIRDKKADYVWSQPKRPAPNVPAVLDARSDKDTLTFRMEMPAWGGPPVKTIIALTLPDGEPELRVAVGSPDLDGPIKSFPFFEPFLASGGRPVLAVADYSNGHLYPLDQDPFPCRWVDGDRLNMPWVGVSDLESGRGYLLLLETSDDSVIRCERYEREGRLFAAPQVVWRPSKGAFGYTRKIRYRFFPRGGYVAIAKAYREYARRQGLIVPLSEKAKRNPRLSRLFGAPDVWGDASLKFAREAKAAGVEKMLIHGRSSAEEMKQVVELGYLPGEYDNYTDVEPITPAKGLDSNHDRIPENVVLQDDGKRMAAWLTFDKKTQFMKRCPAKWLEAAREVVPKALSAFPFLARFIDVTTAESLYECFDSAHPLTRADKRQCGIDLLKYVRSQGVVVGGEHGIWWAVPHLDYIEGMMSSYQFSWPAGHLIHPTSKGQEFTSPWGQKLPSWSEYESRGLGHAVRAPLWELVFHDCVVSTWYWGDASDWLLDAAPEVTAKKDAFNVLYGTIPLMWANREGSWQKDRETFLRTYRSTCKFHAIIAGKELVDHTFLTGDHAVQQTRFAGGTTAIVNFGETPFNARVAGKQYSLPKNGWVVKGPGIEQSRAIEGGRIVTRIKTRAYSHEESAPGRP